MILGSFCVFMCVHMMHVSVVCAHVEIRRRHRLCCFRTLYLILLRQGLSLDLKPAWKGAGPSKPLSPSHSSGLTDMYSVTPDCLCVSLGCKFRTPCLHSKSSYPLNHFPRSPALIFCLVLVLFKKLQMMLRLHLTSLDFCLWILVLFITCYVQNQDV